MILCYMCYCIFCFFSFNKCQLSMSIHVDVPTFGHNIRFCSKNMTQLIKPFPYAEHLGKFKFFIKTNKAEINIHTPARGPGQRETNKHTGSQDMLI